ncbi:hypothetical protein MSAN_02128100 [Mycena sanguinolenta]|uniref:Transmembrane protein n=1 Tax=Mycena sanguinolenta TaxID=230812 RepID=A0A8H6XHC5_9AGAR|nr:hypothetical protein MSAN_02128100 [Mycena sanguinolenta]
MRRVADFSAQFSPSTIMTEPQSQPIRTVQVCLELLFSATVSFVLTFALLPLFGVHATTLTVLRVTGICTLVVFAVLEAFCSSFYEYSGRSVAVANDNPEFKLNPRALTDSEQGWSRGKRAIHS